MCSRGRTGEHMCSGAKLAQLEPNAGIFDFCGHARNFWRDSIEPINRGMQLRRYLLPSSSSSSLFHCRKIDGKKEKKQTKRRDITGDKNSSYWNRPLIRARCFLPSYLFIRFLFFVFVFFFFWFGLVYFLSSFPLSLVVIAWGMQPLNQIKRGMYYAHSGRFFLPRNACARRSFLFSLIENKKEDKRRRSCDKSFYRSWVSIRDENGSLWFFFFFTFFFFFFLSLELKTILNFNKPRSTNERNSMRRKITRKRRSHNDEPLFFLRD